jgi:hypothetical protein
LIELVPSPIPGQAVASVRIAASQSGEIRGVFTVRDTTRIPYADPSIIDSVDLWYAEFSANAWRNVTRFATARYARLDAVHSSQLIELGGQAVFAYSFDRRLSTRSNARGNQGVVIVRGAGPRWTFDTLHTLIAPTHVSISIDPNSESVVLALVQGYFDSTYRPRASSVFAVTFDSGWGTPHLVAGDGVRPLYDADIGRLGATMEVSWRSRTNGGLTTAALSAPAFSKATPIRVARSAARAEERTLLGDSTLLWFGYLGESRDSAQVSVRWAGEEHVSQALFIPNHIYRTPTIAMTDSTALVVTSEVAGPTHRVPALTYATVLNVSCRPTNDR